MRRLKTARDKASAAPSKGGDTAMDQGDGEKLISKLEVQLAAAKVSSTAPLRPQSSRPGRARNVRQCGRGWKLALTKQLALNPTLHQEADLNYLVSQAGRQCGVDERHLPKAHSREDSGGGQRQDGAPASGKAAGAGEAAAAQGNTKDLYSAAASVVLTGRLLGSHVVQQCAPRLGAQRALAPARPESRLQPQI